MDLLSVVVKPTWKEFLIELVQSRQMDPWDIDLCAVSDAYLHRVRELQALDLRVPANVILACALMLRFKADTISFDEPEPDEYYEAPELVQEELPQLVYRPNRPRKRGVTLQELIKAVEQVMKQGERPVVKFAAVKELEFDLPKADMDELMQVVYEKAHTLKDAEGVVLFSQLMQKVDGGLLNAGTVQMGEVVDAVGPTVNEATQAAGNGAAQGNGNTAAQADGNGVGAGKAHAGHAQRKANAHKLLNSYQTRAEGVVYHLLPVLHLVQENKLLSWQNEFFGEIFIRVVDGTQAFSTTPAVAPSS